MSSIEKLAIQGIRSFKPEASEVIEFGTPLTLICGQNGCGKTTIIECLKYATTGFLPPNSKGGAFINDPQVSGRKTVTAQIKLSFNSVGGPRYIITRTMQLQVKGKGKYTFKTLENLLEKTVKNEKRAVSGKSNDIDIELPVYLGITKPILDYVIFCHQDESLWPLSEPSVLKKKFDDIFQASKFTKVLENLKNLNKDLSVDIKLLEKSVDHLKVDKRRSKKIIDELNELKIKIGVLNDEIGDLSIQITDNEGKLEGLFNTNQEFQAILSKYEQLTYNRSTLTQQIERLINSIEILPQTIDELMNKLENFNNLLDEQKHHITELNSQISGYKEEEKQLQVEFNELNKTQGSLNFKESQYKSNLAKLQETLVEQQDKMGYLATADKEIADLTSKYNSTKNSNDLTRKERTKRLQSIIELISNQNQFKTMKNDSIKDFEAKINGLEKSLKSLDMSEDQLNESKAEFEKMTKKYNSSKTSNFVQNLDSEISSNEQILHHLEAKFDELNKSLQNFNNQNELINRINHINDTIKGLETSIDSNVSILEDLIPGLNKGNFEANFNKEYKKSSNDLDNQKKIRESKHDGRSSIQTTIKITQKEIDTLKRQLDVTKRKITPVISEEEITSYPSILKETEDDYNESLQTLKTFEVSKDFRIKAVEISQSNNSCLLCRREFKGSELDGFIGHLNNEIDNMKKDQVIQQFEETKQDYDQLKGIESEVLAYQKLNKDITVKTEELTKMTNDLTTVGAQVEESEQKLEKISQNYEKLNDSKYLVDQIKKSIKQVGFNKEKLETLNSELKEAGVSESIDIDDLNKSINDNNLEIKSLRSKINNDKELKYAKSKEMNKMNTQLKDLEIQIKNLENGLMDSKNFKRSISEYKENIITTKLEIEQIEQKLNNLNKDKHLETEEQTLLFKQFETEENSLQQQLQSLTAKVSTTKTLIDSVQVFETEDQDKLLKNKQDIERITKEIEQTTEKINQCLAQIKGHEKEIHESSNVKSIIRDNIDYQNLQTELEELEQEIQSLNITDAEEAKTEYQTQSKSLREKITLLNSENSFKIGQVKQINEHIKSLQKELNTEYKDIDKCYHEEWIRLQTNLLISSDINTYSKSIDNAIMKYHSIKMEEINKMLKFLWTSTYKGTDIDSISIRSDVNTTGGKGRSYNYRVVMNKNDTELDMRGRCSAGQRVLTSILIRLTLAECFGANCGIIALDEPTTNLDDQNAIGLAESINKIIETRKGQKNFQLVIISHDQNFLSRIRTDNDAFFYRVERDEHQNSVIKRAPIYDQYT